MPSTGGVASVAPRQGQGPEEPHELVALDQGARPVGFMLTWNGDWGLVPPEILPATSSGERDIPATCRHICEHRPFQALFEDAWATLQPTLAAHGLTRVSLGLELCTGTEGPVRVHLHCFATLGGDQKKCRGHAMWRALAFRGRNASHCNPCLPGRGQGARVKAEAQGHYYVQAPKIGSIFTRSTWVKLRDWPVRASYVMTLWRQRKLSHDDARLEVIESRDRAHVWLSEIDKLAKEEYAVRCARAAGDAVAAGPARPFRPAEGCELEWLAQYAQQPEGQPALRRFRPLIYDGPSRTGKTERAVHWFGESATLVLNCQGVQSPCLHAWLLGAHKAIVYDEADWTLVWANRQLMQAGPRLVLLGQSACNEHAYSVSVYGAPMLLTSNAFWAGCPPNGPERAWIETNCFYRYIATPTWT
jgi:hypothetical protein